MICDRGLTLGHLIGTLKQFFERLGLTQLRFKPAYNPYTEPSMEIFRCLAWAGHALPLSCRCFPQGAGKRAGVGVGSPAEPWSWPGAICRTDGLCLDSQWHCSDSRSCQGGHQPFMDRHRSPSP